MILSKYNIRYKDKPVTVDIIYNEFTPALLEMYLNVYHTILKMESQYTHYAAGSGFNGLPEGINSYLEYLGVTSPFSSNLDAMDGNDQRRAINRKIFEQMTTKGWEGSSDTPKNNSNIIRYCIEYNENIDKFLNDKQIEQAKKYLTTNELEFINSHKEEELTSAK